MAITAQHTLLTLQQQANNQVFASLHDLHSNRILSIQFIQPNDSLIFAKMIALAKFMGQPNQEVTTVNLNELANTAAQSNDQQQNTCREGSSVYVKYSGWLVDTDPKKGLAIGKLFDTNENTTNLFRFKFGESEVIRGWEHALKGVKVGGKKFCIIPAHLAYGERGVAGVIPANSTLCFQIEVVKVKKVKQSTPVVSNVTPISPPQPIQQVQQIQQQQAVVAPQEADLKTRMAKIGAHSYGLVLSQQPTPQSAQVMEQEQSPVVVLESTPTIQTPQQNGNTSALTSSESTSNVSTTPTTNNPQSSGNTSELEALKQQIATLQSLIVTQSQPSSTTTPTVNSVVSTTTVEKPVEKPTVSTKQVITTSGGTQWIDDFSVLASKLDKIEKNIESLSFTQLIRNASKFSADFDEADEDDERHGEDEEDKLSKSEKDVYTNGYQIKKFKKSHLFMSGPLLIENIQHLIATNMKLQDDLHKEREQVDSLIEKISQLRKKQEKYAQQQLELTHLSLESNNLSEKGMYEEELQKLNETITGLRKQLAEQKRKTSRAQEQIQSEKDNIENLNSEIEVLKKEIEELNADFKKKKTKADADNKEKLESLDEEWKEKLQRVERENESAIQKLKKEHKQELDRIKNEFSENLEKSIKSSENGAESIKENLEKLWKEKLRSLEEQSREEIESLKLSIKTLNTTNANQLSEISTLKQEVEQKTEEMEEMESSNMSNLTKMREKFLEALETKSENVRSLFVSLLRTLVNKIYHTFLKGINGKKNYTQDTLSAFLGKIVKKFSLKAINYVSEEFQGVDILNFDTSVYVDYEEDEEEEVDEKIQRRRELLQLDLDEEESEEMELEEAEESENEQTPVPEINREEIERTIREQLENEWREKLNVIHQENETLKQGNAELLNSLATAKEVPTVAIIEEPLEVVTVSTSIENNTAIQSDAHTEEFEQDVSESMETTMDGTTVTEENIEEDTQEETIAPQDETVPDEITLPATKQVTEEQETAVGSSQEQVTEQQEAVVGSSQEEKQEETNITEDTVGESVQEEQVTEEENIKQEEPITIQDETEPISEEVSLIEQERTIDSNETEVAPTNYETEQTVEETNEPTDVAPEVAPEENEERKKQWEEESTLKKEQAIIEEATNIEQQDLATQEEAIEASTVEQSTKTNSPFKFDLEEDTVAVSTPKDVDPWLSQTQSTFVPATKNPSLLFDEEEEDEETKKKKQEELQKKKKATTSKLFDNLEDDFW